MLIIWYQIAYFFIICFYKNQSLFKGGIFLVSTVQQFKELSKKRGLVDFPQTRRLPKKSGAMKPRLLFRMPRVKLRHFQLAKFSDCIRTIPFKNGGLCGRGLRCQQGTFHRGTAGQGSLVMSGRYRHVYRHIHSLTSVCAGLDIELGGLSPCCTIIELFLI